MSKDIKYMSLYAMRLWIVMLIVCVCIDTRYIILLTYMHGRAYTGLAYVST